MPKRQIFTVTQVVAIEGEPYVVYEARVWASGAPEAIRRSRLGLAPCWRVVNSWGRALSTFLHYSCEGAYELYDANGRKEDEGDEWQTGGAHRIALISQSRSYCDSIKKLPLDMQRRLLRDPDDSEAEMEEAKDQDSLMKQIHWVIHNKTDSLVVARSHSEMTHIVDRTAEMLSEEGFGFGVHCGSSITFGYLEDDSQSNSIRFSVVQDANDSTYKSLSGLRFDYVCISDATGLANQQVAWLLDLGREGGAR